MLRYADRSEIEEAALTICSSLAWFDGYIAAASSVLAELVSSLNVAFPLERFVDLLFTFHSSVDNFSCLFAELQYFNCFGYGSFLDVLTKRGWIVSRREETTLLVLAMPCMSRSASVLNRLSSSLHRLCPNNTFNRDLARIGTNVAHNLELASTLPAVLKWQLALWLADTAEDFGSAGTLIAELGAPICLVSLYQRAPTASVPIT
jgi:hypothetical protein